VYSSRVAVQAKGECSPGLTVKPGLHIPLKTGLAFMSEEEAHLEHISDELHTERTEHAAERAEEAARHTEETVEELHEEQEERIEELEEHVEAAHEAAVGAAVAASVQPAAPEIDYERIRGMIREEVQSAGAPSEDEEPEPEPEHDEEPEHRSLLYRRVSHH
jgi:hypothetical protein